MNDRHGGLDLKVRWYRCTLGCGARYQSEKAAELCCDRAAQKAEKGRLAASKEQ